MEINDYTIITDSNASDLADRVKEYLKRGWKISGSVSVAIYENRERLFAQALIK